jgi:GNAT superfamily N-acetyltransferase
MSIIKIEPFIPNYYINLIWSIFFTSKNRGIDIHVHFPWLIFESNFFSVTIFTKNGDFIGGVIVKTNDNKVSKSKLYKTASLGLVCIDTPYQKMGYAKLLLSAAITEARRQNYDALTLWTQKYDVYKPHGFEVLDSSMFGWLDTTNCIDSNHNPNTVKTIAFQKNLSLPAFALKGIVFQVKETKVYCLEDKQGLIVAKWEGDNLDVINILSSMPKKKFRINIKNDDILLSLIPRYNILYDLQPSYLQMWLTLNENINKKNWSEIYFFSVLDRI